MNIVVCIKQVPGSNNVNVDPVTGTLIRDGANSKMNPYDLNALELGLKLKEKTDGKLFVVSMGPNSAIDVIKEAIYMGADGGVLISDRKFGGADVLATSYTLSSGIRTIENVDLIITGKQTTDGDTAQVGSELAEHLSLPHIANVRTVELEDNKLVYTANLDDLIVHGKIELPCLICTDSDVNTPRLPSFKRKLEYRDCEALIRLVTFADVKDQDETHYGLKGSPTQVERIFEPEKKKEKQIISDGDLSEETYRILKEHKFV